MNNSGFPAGGETPDPGVASVLLKKGFENGVVFFWFFVGRQVAALLEEDDFSSRDLMGHAPGS